MLHFGFHNVSKPAILAAPLATVFLFVLTAGLPLPARAQQAATGTLEGTVFDESGARIPGVTVTLRNPETNATSLQVTDAQGEYRFTNVAARGYMMAAELEGFETVERPFVFVFRDQVRRQKIILPIAAEPEEVIIRSAGNAAGSRPPFLPMSEASRGGMIVGFGANTGPDEVVTAPGPILDPNLAGFTSWVESGGQRHDCFPVFAFRNQFACALSSNVSTGEADFYVEYQGNRSNAFRLRIVDVQPGFFAMRGDGQNMGIFTRTDFSLIDFDDPAIPGDALIGWGTGFGAALQDDRPIAHDKRALYDRIEFTLGGVPLSEFPYIGAAGGFAGGDQFAFVVPANVPTGCAVPLIGGVEVNGIFRAANPVFLPISADGGPCGDALELSSDAIARMTGQGAVTVGSTFVTDFGPGGLLQAVFQGRRFTPQTYTPPPAPNTCFYTWLPETFSTPFFPEPLTGTGGINLDFPWGDIQLSDETVPPHNVFLDRPPNFTDGPYTVNPDNFFVEGEPFSESWEHTFSGAAARGNQVYVQEINQQEQFRFSTNLGPRLDLWEEQRQGQSPETLFFDYQSEYADGPLGSHEIRCLLPANFDAEMAASVVAQEAFLRTSLVPPDASRVFADVQFTVRDTNMISRQGPFDFTREVFGSVSGQTIEEPIPEN